MKAAVTGTGGDLQGGFPGTHDLLDPWCAEGLGAGQDMYGLQEGCFAAGIGTGEDIQPGAGVNPDLIQNTYMSYLQPFQMHLQMVTGAWALRRSCSPCCPRAAAGNCYSGR